MRPPNRLDSRLGRLVAFFFLHVTEGIPLGFGAVAIATQLRRQDVGPAEIGAFVGALYLPWAFKWAFGPFIDVFVSERLGRRRGWILGTQLGLIATLLVCVPLDPVSQLGLLSAVLLLHNSFGAMQDVAIDALAASTLQADERGLANGVMFAAAALGMALGGAGMLFIMNWIGVPGGFLFVAGCIALVTVFIVLPLREPPTPAARTSRCRPGRRGGRDAALLGRRLPRLPGHAWRLRRLVTALWVATLTCSVGQGLTYGTRSAIFMDVTRAKVAATQFTAYMAMMNLVISYSATWQGIAAEAIGYPRTLPIDGVTGLLCLALLPLIRPSATPLGDGRGPQRARARPSCWRWPA